MINCRRVAGILVDYAFRELDEEESSQVETHLRACLACQAAVAQYREIFRLLIRLHPLQIPSGLVEHLRGALTSPP